MGNFLKQALTLARVSSLPTVWTNCLAGWGINAVALGHALAMPPSFGLQDAEPFSLLALLLGASLVYAGGCTLNDAFDEGFDRKYNPERPIPSRKVTSATAWILGMSELAAGSALLFLGAGCSALWITLLVCAILAYDFLHKRWAGSYLLMGSCRVFLWLTAATVGEAEDVAPQTLAWALCLGAYVVGITLFARGESKEREAPRNFSIILLFFPPLLALAGLIYWHQLDPTRQALVNLSGLLAAWIAYRSILHIKGQGNGSIGKGVSLLLSGICATDAVAVAFYLPGLTGPCLLCVCLAQSLQKKFAAT